MSAPEQIEPVDAYDAIAAHDGPATTATIATACGLAPSPDGRWRAAMAVSDLLHERRIAAVRDDNGDEVLLPDGSVQFVVIGPRPGADQ